MNKQVRVRLALLLTVYAGMITLSGLWAQDSRPKEAAKPESSLAPMKSTAATVPVKPKPLSGKCEQRARLPGQPAAPQRRLEPG